MKLKLLNYCDVRNLYYFSNKTWQFRGREREKESTFITHLELGKSQIILDSLFSELDFLKYLLFMTHLCFFGLQRQAIRRSKELDRHETRTPRSGTLGAPTWPQNQPPSPLPLPVNSKGYRQVLFPSTEVSMSPSLLLLSFMTNKTLRSTHRYKGLMLFAYFMPAVNPEGRWQYKCSILQGHLAAIKATDFLVNDIASVVGYLLQTQIEL